MVKKRIDVKRLKAGIRDSAAMIAGLDRQARHIAAVCELVVGTLRAGNKILVAGHGGSAAEAMHFAEELVGRFRTNRVSLPSVALVADGTALTCIGNDFGFDRVFSRQIEGLGQKGDMLVLFSTSGKARSLELALEMAQSRGMRTVCLLGRDGGPLAGRADAEVIVPGAATERIQEAHQVLLHLILDAVEQEYAEAAK
jgi:D-sedoheptulose 7-phosphate isomerase